MPKLTLASENQKYAAVVQVITLMQSGMKLNEALEVANLSIDQYYRWVNRSEETIEVFYEMIDESEKRELATILAKREYLIDKAIEKAEKEKASITELLFVVSYMDKRREEIETRQGVTDNAELRAKEYLNGPMTSVQTSRLSATSQVEEDGSLSIKIKSNEIIEGEILHKEQPEQEPNLESIQEDPFARPQDLDLPLDSLE